MTGLEKIISTIENDAEQSAEKILDNAKLQAKKIREEGQKKADDAYESYICDCKRDCEREYENSVSAAQAESGRTLLAIRARLLEQAKRLAAEKIKQMSDEEYFSLILRTVRKCSRPTDGILSLNECDLKRLPNDFSRKINEGFDKRLEISKLPADIDGGFLISFGNITENCSIAAVMEAESERANDAAARVLFTRGEP